MHRSFCFYHKEQSACPMRNRIRRKPCADLRVHHYARQSCARCSRLCRGASRGLLPRTQAYAVTHRCAALLRCVECDVSPVIFPPSVVRRCVECGVSPAALSTQSFAQLLSRADDSDVRYWRCGASLEAQRAFPMRNRIRRKPCADLGAHHNARQSCALFSL